MATPTPDLNDVITSAVHARVEASVLEALSGDEFFGRMVAATLTRNVEVTDPRDRYRKIQVPFLSTVIDSVLKQAVESAARRLVTEQAEHIEEAVRKELKKSSADLARQLVGSMSAAAERAYGISVELKYAGRD